MAVERSCIHCGETLEETDPYCSSCGTDVEEE